MDVTDPDEMDALSTSPLLFGESPMSGVDSLAGGGGGGTEAAFSMSLSMFALLLSLCDDYWRPVIAPIESMSLLNGCHCFLRLPLAFAADDFAEMRHATWTYMQATTAKRTQELEGEEVHTFISNSSKPWRQHHY